MIACAFSFSPLETCLCLYIFNTTLYLKCFPPLPHANACISTLSYSNKLTETLWFATICIYAFCSWDQSSKTNALSKPYSFWSTREEAISLLFSACVGNLDCRDCVLPLYLDSQLLCLCISCYLYSNNSFMRLFIILLKSPAYFRIFPPSQDPYITSLSPVL